MVTYWDFNDPLIQTYTLPYLKAMDKVCDHACKLYLVTFNKTKVSPKNEDLFSPLFFKYYSNKILAAFHLFTCFFRLLYIIKNKKINFIHSWCTPAGSLAYLLSKFSGKPLVLDSFEPHAESMVENGTWTKNSLAFKLLFYFEKLQLEHAKHIIGLTSVTRDYIQSAYGLKVGPVYLKPSCVNISDFSVYTAQQQKELRLANSILPEHVVGIYVGKFGGIYLNEEIYHLLNRCALQWKTNFKLIILSPGNQNEILENLKKYGLEKHLLVLKKASTTEVIHYLNMADFAINPVKPVPSKRYCTSIKDGEYWAVGLPVIITKDISDDSEIIQNNNIGSVIDSLDDYGYSKSVQEMGLLLKSNTDHQLNIKIKEICKKYRSFNLAENIYKEIYLNAKS